MFNKLAAVAADASLGLQICGPVPDSFYNGNMHYKMEGVICASDRMSLKPEIIIDSIQVSSGGLMMTGARSCIKPL